MSIFRYTIYITFILLLCSCQQKEINMFSSLSPSQTGIRFKNILRETEAFNVMKYGYFYNGGGVAVGDINNDGLPDIYFTGNLVASHLYMNKGNMQFEEVAHEAGVRAEGLWNTGTVMADVNGDGWLDIYVCRSAAANHLNRINQLFINQGVPAGSPPYTVPTFTEEAEYYGLNDEGYSTTAAFFDYDRDGDLDMYLLNHSVQDFAGFSNTLSKYKERINPNFGDKLFRNEGPLDFEHLTGGFVEVATVSGLHSNILGFGLGVAISDINLDGWPDIYVSNDYNEQDYLYINNQDGTFTDSLEYYLTHTSMFSMGNDIADINNDGLPDIMSLDMLPESNERIKMSSGPDNYDKYLLLKEGGFYQQNMRNMLHLNNGQGAFSEIGQISGISNTDWSWAALFQDYDNDGWKDLFISNGYAKDYTNMEFMSYTVAQQMKAQQTGEEVAVFDLIDQMPSIDVPNYIFKNNGDLTFTKKTDEWGLDQILQSNGAAYADLDLDGDMDLITNNINAPASIFQNNAETLTNHHYINIRLKGNTLNTYGIGAKVTIVTSNQRQFQELMPFRGYQSSVEPILHFGLGRDSLIEEIIVQWPEGGIQSLEHITVDQFLEISQENSGDSMITTQPLTTESSQVLFRETEPLIEFSHRENDFNDFKQQLLIPRMYSTQGPRIAEGDMNNDGRIDFYIGGAKGQSGAIFMQTSSGTFKQVNPLSFEEDHHSEDIGSLWFDADQDGDMDLYVVSGGNETQSGSSDLQDRLYENRGNGNFVKDTSALPVMLSSGSCVVADDWDRDGDQDLFVGGRIIPGRYPETPRSYLLINQGDGTFVEQTQELAPGLQYIGMVSDAVWADINQDNQSDLIVVGEWMRPTCFISQSGKLIDQTDTFFPAGLYGWWNCITSADLDSDGDIDFVLGNHGTNTQFQASRDEPVELYAGDFDNNGSIDPIMTYYVDGESYPMASRDDMLSQLIFLKKKFTSYTSYANATIGDLLDASQLARATVFTANTLSSGVLLNQGDGECSFQALPLEAQFSPIYAIEIKDFDQDGQRDILLGGNLSSSRVKFGEIDANRGLILSGTGSGQFVPLSQQLSGLNVRGDVRDVKIFDNAVGETLLLVARSNASVLMYRGIE